MNWFPRVARELTPDLFIIDIELHEWIFAALATGKPVLLSSTFLSLKKHPALPPLHTAMTPHGHGAFSLFSAQLAWLIFRIRKMARRNIDYLKMAGADRVSSLRQFAKDNNLDFGRLVDLGQWLIPFSYRDLRVLNLNAKELDFDHETSPEIRFVGPMVCVRRVESFPNFADSETAKLKKLLDGRRSGRMGSLVYCAFGRFEKSYSSTLLMRIVEAFRGRTDLTLLLSLGGSSLALDSELLPDNAFQFRWVPQLQVLEVADCAIIHAGISSINECLFSKVPMLSYSLGIVDQEGNAARVAYHGLGIAGDRKRDTSETIAGYVERLLTDASFRSRLQEMKAHMNRYERDLALAAVIDETLDQLGGRA